MTQQHSFIPRLIILSDIQGINSWIENYEKRVASFYDVTIYDIRTLAGFSTYNTEFDYSSLHQQFITNGIQKAVKNLIHIETQPAIFIGFSMGGTIAWKVALQTKIVEKLIAVSATRLRFEKQQPTCHKYLIYGDKDPFQPSKSWFDNLHLEPKIIQNADHQLYHISANVPIILHPLAMPFNQ